MAIAQRLHNGLLAISTTATSPRFLLGSSSWLEYAMLQNRVFQNYPVNYLRSSPVQNGDKFQKFTQLEFRKVRTAPGTRTAYPKYLNLASGPHLSLDKGNADGYGPAFTLLLMACFPRSAMPTSRFSNSTVRCCIKLGSHYSGVFVKRYFSQVPRAFINKSDNVGVVDGRVVEYNSSFNVLNKCQKLAKPLAANGKNLKGEAEVAICNMEMEKSASNSKILDVKAVDKVSLKNQPVEDGNKTLDVGVSNVPGSNNNQALKPTGKAKRQARSKERKGQSSNEAVQSNGSEGVSRPKKNNSINVDSCNQLSEIKTNVHNSVSTEAPPKKTTKTSRRKGQSTKESNAVKSEGGQEGSSGNVLIQRQQTISSNTKQLKKQTTIGQLYPSNGKSVVVVESVTKAKVIQGYLGDMFEVIPSYGHVRDLAARSGSVRPDDDFSMVWEVPSAAWTHLKSIKVALNGAENLILASDPDREGEAIAWHIIEMLQQQDALSEDLNVARVVFNEITESSIKNALQAPRDIDVNLVHAYLARRALDYLIGFNISPLLWRKLPGCRSAGRVQSAALSLICDREMEIDEFKPQEYWTVEVGFSNKEPISSINGFSFSSHLTYLNSKRLDQLAISSRSEAIDIEQKINSSVFEVVHSKRSKVSRNPPTPYITSTIQQDAANKLHFSATYTMKIAQKLYEGVQLSDEKAAGLITYIRTDGSHISDEAARDIRSLIVDKYGRNFVSNTTRKYFKKVKNAQEAHEAIRPTDIKRLPSMLVGLLDEDSWKLYALIWSRTVACQMASMSIEQIQIDVGNSGQSITLRSSCSIVDFSGYQAVYDDVETKAIKHNENEGDDRLEVFKVLSSLKSGDRLYVDKLDLQQHFTQPPPRYSEGSLIKRLEELGIGRPSTYATTIKVLKDRKYVTVKSRIFYPEFRGRMVSAFLAHHFSEVTDYCFTADMETELDNVSAGLTEWKGLLGDYWTRFSKYCEIVSNVQIRQVEKMLEKTFGNFLFASLPDKSRTCPSCLQGTLNFKVSKVGEGYFIGCDQHPKCKYIAKTLYGDDDEEVTPQNNQIVEEPKLLGLHPVSNEKVLLKNGPYGYYVQLGDMKGHLPKRVSLSPLKGIKGVESVTLKDALELLQYPVTLGNHPEDGRPVMLKLAKGGYSISHGRNSVTVPKNLNPRDVTLEKASKLLLGENVKRRGRPKNNQRKIHEAEVM